MTDWILIIGMTLVTFLPRYIPLALAGKIKITPLFSLALSYVPIAVMSIIIIQATMIKEGEISMVMENHKLLASIVAFVVAIMTKHMFLTIIAGLISFVLIKITFNQGMSVVD